MSLRFTGMFTIWLKLMFQKFGGLGFLKGTILLRNHCLWLLANVVWFLQQMIIDMMPSFISSQHYQRKLDLLVLKIHYWIFLIEYLETLWLGSLLQELLTCAMIHAFVFLTLCSIRFLKSFREERHQNTSVTKAQPVKVLCRLPNRKTIEVL